MVTCLKPTRATTGPDDDWIKVALILVRTSCEKITFRPLGRRRLFLRHFGCSRGCNRDFQFLRVSSSNDGELRRGNGSQPANRKHFLPPYRPGALDRPHALEW